MPGAIRSLRQSTSTSLPPACRSSRSSPPPATTDTEQVFQTIVQNRKSWKTARGGETVWPPELESALLEGLASYQPDDSRETRLLGRFPMRNRIISDYIFGKTGKRRTAKQVGSRLQQLRDTVGGDKLLKLLTPIPKRSSPGKETSKPLSSTAEDSRTVICIDILPDGVSCPCASHSCRFSSAINGVRTLDARTELGVHSRPLHAIDPTITFTATSDIDASSLFTVYHDMTVIYTQTIPLTCSSSSVTEGSDGCVLLSTPLVPGYWDVICSSDDPTRYTIEHRVEAMSTSSLIFSALYKFAYPFGMTSRGAPMHQLHVPTTTYFSPMSRSDSPADYRSHHNSSFNSNSRAQSLLRSDSPIEDAFSSFHDAHGSPSTESSSSSPSLDFPILRLPKIDFNIEYSDMMIFDDDYPSTSSVHPSSSSAQKFSSAQMYAPYGGDESDTETNSSNGNALTSPLDTYFETASPPHYI